jgi:hypothetical protein
MLVFISMRHVKATLSRRPPDRPLSITEARPILGELFEAAFQAPGPVRIQRGNRIIRLVPEQIPEPVEVLPPGAIVIDEERASMLNRFPNVPMAPQF